LDTIDDFFPSSRLTRASIFDDWIQDCKGWSA
jgi:hypothetical protein